MTQIVEHDPNEREKVAGLAASRPDRGGLSAPARRAAGAQRGRPAQRGRARPQGLRAENRGRDPALAQPSPPGWGCLPPATRVERIAICGSTGSKGRQLVHGGRVLRSPGRSVTRQGVASRREGRGDRIRRPAGLLRLVVQPRHRRLARASADRLGRGRGDRAATSGPLAERLPHAQGSRRRRVPRRHDGPRPVRCAAARTRERRTRPRLRPPRALRGPRGLPLARPLDRALRARRPSRGTRAPEAEARAEGLFAAERKRPLPRPPPKDRPRDRQRRRREARPPHRDHARFPPARILVAETYVQGPRAAVAITEALRAICEAPEIDVVIVARGGGSFEDLLPFSDERLVRALATCPVPTVSAVGHEQDTPLSDLVADARASTPTAAARLVVPDLADLTARLDRSRTALATRSPRGTRPRAAATRRHARPSAQSTDADARTAASRARALGRPAPRPVPTRHAGTRLRDRPRRRRDRPLELPGRRRHQVDVELGTGGFGARVEETR